MRQPWLEPTKTGSQVGRVEHDQLVLGHERAAPEPSCAIWT